MVRKGSAVYQAKTAEMDAEQAAREKEWTKETKLRSLKAERERYSDDPALQAEIDRELAEIETSN